MCNRRDFLVCGPAGVHAYPMHCPLGVLGVYVHIYMYIYICIECALECGAGGVEVAQEGGGGRRGNGIELKVTDAPAPVSLPRLL